MADRFGQFDAASAQRIAASVRYVEGMVRGDIAPPPNRAASAERWEFGRLDQAVTAGVLTGGETMTVWLGPGHAGSDRATSTVISIDYATDDLDADTYVTATRKRGKWYVMPWDCPPDEEDPVE